MITHRTIAKVVNKMMDGDSSREEDVSTKVTEFLRRHGLLSVFLKSKSVLRREAVSKESQFTLRIAARRKEDITGGVLDIIKSSLGVESGVKVHIKEDVSIKAGYLAYYNNKMIDCRLEERANALSQKLKEQF